MSGLEGLAALSLACNIFETISFTRETLSLLKRIYRDGRPDPSLDERAVRIGTTADTLSKHLTISMPQPLTEAQNKLRDVADGCVKAAEKLREELQHVSLSGTHRGRLSTAKIALKAMWRKPRLERLEEDLSGYQKTMETSAVLQTYIRSEARQVEQSEGFDNLSAQLQQIVSQLSVGQAKLGDVQSRIIAELSPMMDALMMEVRGMGGSLRTEMRNETTRAQQSVEAHVTTEVVAMRDTIKGHVSATARTVQQTVAQSVQKLDMSETHQRLLDSLHYPEMNERRNRVVTRHHDTFRWVFDDFSKSDDETSSSEAGSLEAGSSDAEHSRTWDSFPLWLASEGKLFWITGKPGSGKSTLMKFILSSDETISALEKWRPGCRILSHFFWAPGTLMQRSIRGLLCSLLYQALLDDEKAIGAIMHSYRELRNKRSVSDWDLEELKNVLFHVLGLGTRPFGLFIDGLDEALPDDDNISLLQLIDELRDAPVVKLCISSRPELPLRQHFDSYPCLRMDELTYWDIKKYARDKLLAPSPQCRITRKELDDLVAGLVRKADGVFLWVALTTKSIRRGLEKGDRFDELWQRLNAMPSDLQSFYQSMWDRLSKEDRDVYWKTATLYFSIIGEFVESQSCDMSHMVVHYDKPTVFDLMTFSDEAVQNLVDNRVAEPDVVLSDEKLREKCEDTLRYIEVRCGGLLETSSVEEDDTSELSTEHGVLDPYTAMVVSFIHRTAYDFIFSSGEARDTLHVECARLSKDEIGARIIRGNLFLCWLKLPGYHYDLSILLRVMCQRIQDDTNRLRLCHLIQSWYARGYLGEKPALSVCELRGHHWPNFIFQLIHDNTESFPTGQALMQSEVDKTRTKWDGHCRYHILSALFMTPFDKDEDYDKRFSLMRFLLQDGVNLKLQPTEYLTGSPLVRFKATCVNAFGSDHTPFTYFLMICLDFAISSFLDCTRRNRARAAEQLFLTIESMLTANIDWQAPVCIIFGYASEPNPLRILQWPWGSSWPSYMNPKFGEREDINCMIIAELDVLALIRSTMRYLGLICANGPPSNSWVLEIPKLRSFETHVRVIAFASCWLLRGQPPRIYNVAPRPYKVPESGDVSRCYLTKTFAHSLLLQNELYAGAAAGNERTNADGQRSLRESLRLRMEDALDRMKKMNVTELEELEGEGSELFGPINKRGF